jgi:pyruvate dehydrogenase E2 component (dihydrolipoamide acetyltransferase)
MAVDLKLPPLGESTTSGQVIRVMVALGDVVVVDQPVLELETGKATVEVPASTPGRVTSIHVSAGDTVKVGQPMLTVEETDVPALSAPPAVRPKTIPPSPGPAKTLPPAPAVLVAAEGTPAVPPAVVATPGTRPPGEYVPAAPHVRQFAREIGVPVDQVQGTGPGGRVSVEDVKAHARTARAGAAGRPARPALPDLSRWGPVVAKPMSGVRLATAQQMDLSWREVPRVTLDGQADITDLESYRVSFRPRTGEDVKLTVTAFLVKAAALGLRAHPDVNVAVDMERGELLHRGYVHVGVATDTPRGLLVPVIRDVDKKSLVEVASELARLAERARAGKLGLEEMAGASFTVTNLGGMGVGHFSPVVNFPEVAILAVGKARMTPTWREGAFVPRLQLPLSLAFDHRAVDGAGGARFLAHVVTALEQPFLGW